MKPKTVGRVDGGQQAARSYAQLADHGFPVGLSILSADGRLPVEYLAPGDRVVTRNGGLMRLQAVESTTILTRAVAFTAGGMGGGFPETDLVLPAEQPVLLRDWRANACYGASQAMAPAGQLVDDEFVRDIGPRKMLLFRLTFDKPRIIYGGGLELGTSGAINTPLRTAS